MSCIFIRETYVFIVFASFLRIASLIMQAMSVGLLLSWLLDSLPEIINEYISNSVPHYLIPIVSVLIFFCSSILTVLSKKITLHAIFLFEKYVFLVKSVEDISLHEYGGIARVLLSLVDALVPLLLILLVGSLWVYQYPSSTSYIVLFLLLTGAGIAAIIDYISTKHEGSVEKSRAERRLPKNEILKIQDDRRYFYRIIILPQYTSVLMYFVVSLIIAASLVFIKEYYSEEKGLLSSFLPLLTIVSILQLSSMVTLLMRVGMFRELIGKLVLAISNQNLKNKNVNE